MDEQPYAPENDIPPQFWQLIESANRDPEKLRETLRSLDRDLIEDVFRMYAYSQADLVELFMDRDETKDHSEDTLDDLADALLTMGREAYLNAYYEKSELPDEDTWENLPTFIYVFSEVYYERFSDNIFDVLD